MNLLVDDGVTGQEYRLFPTKRYILCRTDGTFLESDDLDVPTTQWTEGKVGGLDVNNSTIISLLERSFIGRLVEYSNKFLVRHKLFTE